MLLLRERLSNYIEREKKVDGFYKQLIDENYLLLDFICQYKRLSFDKLGLSFDELLECVLFNIYKDTSKLKSVDINHETTLSHIQQYMVVALSYYLNDTDIPYQRRKQIVNVLERLYLIRNYCIKNYRMELPCIFFVLQNGFTIILSEHIKSNIKTYVDTLNRSLSFLSSSDKVFLMDYTAHVGIGRSLSNEEHVKRMELLDDYYYLYVHPKSNAITTN